MDFIKELSYFFDVMLGFSVTPIRMISGIGLIVASASFIWGYCSNQFIFEIPVKGIWLLITFLLGLIIVMLGIIGEYLWHIFNETDQKPDSL